MGVWTYGIKGFFRYQNPYGFDGPLKIENVPVSTFLKLTDIRAYCILGWIFFFGLFLKRLREVVGRTSVGGNLERTSVGGNFGRNSAEKHKIVEKTKGEVL